MKCKYCRAPIFWLSCDCGSSVLFDELGWPWPRHHCADLASKPTLSRLGTDDLSGSILSRLDAYKADAIARLIEANMERDYVDAVKIAERRADRHQKQSSWVMRQEPYHNLETTERGVITELIWNANIKRKAGVADGSVGVAMLGHFANIPLAQITIHTGALAESEEENYSFTFFATESAIEKLKVFKGCLVVAQVARHCDFIQASDLGLQRINRSSRLNHPTTPATNSPARSITPQRRHLPPPDAAHSPAPNRPPKSHAHPRAIAPAAHHAPSSASPPSPPPPADPVSADRPRAAPQSAARHESPPLCVVPMPP